MPNVCDKEQQRLLTFVTVGGGPTSCEFVSELHDFISSDVSKWYPDLAAKVRIILVESSDHLLGPFDASLRDCECCFASECVQEFHDFLIFFIPDVKSTFAEKRIDVRTGVAVRKVERSRPPSEFHGDLTTAVLSNGDTIPFGTLVWSAGLDSVKFVNSSPFPTGRTGRIFIDKKCAIPGFDHVFAVGDCAANEHEPLPQLAQVAQQQGKFVADAILNMLDGKPVENEFRLFLLGSMASLGLGKGIVDLTRK